MEPKQPNIRDAHLNPKTPEPPRNNDASAQKTEYGERFNRVLFSALDALEESNIPYALIGGVAASGLGRPRSTHDIDIFVQPEYALASLEALAAKGFETEKRDISWLFKGWKENVLVDIIFKSQGDIYFDEQMRSHANLVHYHGRDVRVVSPEDLVIIKCAASSEVGPHHWYDALAILSHSQLDWEYLLSRAKKAPRRLLSLLIYAQSGDMLIPNNIISELFNTVFASTARHQTVGANMPRKLGAVRNETTQQPTSFDPYMAVHLREALNEKMGETDVSVLAERNQIVLRGEVATEDRKQAIESLVRSTAPGYSISNRISVVAIRGPEMGEVVNQ